MAYVTIIAMLALIEFSIFGFKVGQARGQFGVEAPATSGHETFDRVWHDLAENDGFNRLVLKAGLSWRDIVVLRACCKYLRQATIAFSQTYMERALQANPTIAMPGGRYPSCCFRGTACAGISSASINDSPSSVMAAIG